MRGVLVALAGCFIAENDVDFVYHIIPIMQLRLFLFHNSLIKILIFEYGRILILIS